MASLDITRIHHTLSLCSHCVVDGVQLDLAQMMNQKDKAVKGLTSGIAALFKANKVLMYNIGCHGD